MTLFAIFELLCHASILQGCCDKLGKCFAFCQTLCFVDACFCILKIKGSKCLYIPQASGIFNVFCQSQHNDQPRTVKYYHLTRAAGFQDFRFQRVSLEQI